MQKERREDDILPYKDKTNRGHSFVPPSGREGDHEVVEGARGRKSKECFIARSRCRPASFMACCNPFLSSKKEKSGETKHETL